MRKSHLRPLVLVACLIAVTCTALAYTKKENGPVPVPVPTGTVEAKNGVVGLGAHLTRSKIFTGGDGNFSMALTLTADDVAGSGGDNIHNVDMVVVLDRSGSMQGQKINHARQAVLHLLSVLTPRDRLALISYADGVRRHSNLLPVTDTNKTLLADAAQKITTGGGTNLGAGLRTGIDLLTSAEKTGNLGRVVLISDGLANQGITDPAALAEMASAAARNEFSLSTVGVGSDFNEYLMTAIADQGTGRYYYLENPNAFAEVFRKEFSSTRIAAATKVEVNIPLAPGVSLLDAAGFPVEMKDNAATFKPGNLLSGQTRELFLTFRAATDQEKSHTISGISVSYLHQGRPFKVSLDGPFHIACVNDPRKAMASIDKNIWVKKVLQDDYGKLREKVAHAIRSGRRDEAIGKIEEYKTEQEAVNSVVGSTEVARNLKEELDELRSQVEDTFRGAPAAVAAKQKKNAKSLQYQAYEGRRANQ